MSSGPPKRPPAARGRTEEGPRHSARERAISLLYEADIKGVSYEEVLHALAVEPDPFAAELVRGVAHERDSIDALLGDSTIGWTLERMPLLDVEVLRVATFELMSEAETSTAVIIDEAVELAKEYSTEDSGRFVNGVLSTVAGRVRPS